MKFLTYLRLIERSLLVGLFLAMVVLFFGSVLARELGGSFASRLAWIEEAVRFMNVFLVFLALGLALERGRHVGIDALRDRLPPGPRWALLKLIDATGLLFSLYLMHLGLALVEFVLMTGQRSPTLNIPIGWVYLAPVLGFGLLALRFGLSLLGLIDRFDAPGREGEAR